MDGLYFVCPACSALVVNLDAHKQWHAAQQKPTT